MVNQDLEHHLSDICNRINTLEAILNRPFIQKYYNSDFVQNMINEKDSLRVLLYQMLE